MDSVSSKRPLVRLLCLPDVDRAIGGVKQLYRHSEHLSDLGWDAAIVTESHGFRPSWFSSYAHSISFDQCIKNGEFTSNNTIIVLPETYLSVDLSSFRGHDLSILARVVFNQNAYYTFGDFSSETNRQIQCFYDHPSVLQVLSISEDTHAFLSENLGLSDNRLSRVVNAVEPHFISDYPKANRIHWMPRKNPSHVQAVLHALNRSQLPHSNGWEGSPLVGLSHDLVSERLKSARIFLSFGHPEGFGLPIAEAMASGCWVVGYSGGGGKELFRFGASNHISFGDWTGFINALKSVFARFAIAPRETELLLCRQALAVRSLYSSSQEKQSIANAWDRIYDEFKTWRLRN